MECYSSVLISKFHVNSCLIGLQKSANELLILLSVQKLTNVINELEVSLK